jgi:hypothetical protein
MNLLPNPSPNPLPEGLPNNQTKPNQTQTRPVARAGGVNRSRVEGGNWRSTRGLTPVEVRMETQFAAELAWAKQHLPDEHAPSVALAIRNLKRRSIKPSTKTVVERLKEISMDRTSTEARAARHA